MIRVSKQNPCPVCGKFDWCLVAEDGKACICSRISDGAVKTAGGAGYLHKFDDKPVPVKQPEKYKVQSKPKRNFRAMAAKAFEKTDRQKLAAELGVSVQSLYRLGTGWGGKCWTFPMFDGHRNVIGIRLRNPKGGKYAVSGSRNGLFIPKGVSPENRLFVCEGPTDTAALLDLGYEAIGRASCNTGAEYIIEMIKFYKPSIVIVADKDEAKFTPQGKRFYPGIDGAKSLAKQIKEFSRTVKIIKPPHNKDMRSWYQSGVTAKEIELIIESARFE